MFGASRKISSHEAHAGWTAQQPVSLTENMMMSRMAQMSSGFAPSFETATGEAGGGAVTLETPAPSTPSAETPSATPTPSDSGAGTQPQPKTYAQQDVERMIQERVKKYRDLGDPDSIKAGLEKAKRWEQFEKAFAGGDKTKTLSPEDQAFQKYMQEHFPGVDKVNDVSSQVQSLQKMIYDRQVNEGRGVITSLAKEKLGVDAPGVVEMIEERITASIAADPEARKQWESGNTKIIAAHFDKVLKESLEPLLKSSNAGYSAGKANDKREVPPTMPAGGVSAPTSKTTVPTKDQRVAAAWKMLRDSKA